MNPGDAKCISNIASLESITIGWPGHPLSNSFYFFFEITNNFLRRECENILLPIELLNLVYYLNIFETLIERAGSDSNIFYKLCITFFR